LTKVSQDDVKKWIVKIKGKRDCEEPCGKKIGSQGPEFPELQIWFVSKKKIIELSWNDSYNWEGIR